MPDWLIWMIAAGVLAVAEVSTLTLVLGMIAGGAVAGAITAALGGPLLAQILVALVVTAALLGVIRPIAQRQLHPSGPARTGVDALVGMQAVVLTKVSRDEGLVRLNGAQWSAVSYDPDQTLPSGTVVRVIEIHGATALVMAEPPE